MRLEGNIMNRIAAATFQVPRPEVGMGATALLYSDRHAYTVTRVSKTGKTGYMRRDIATRTDHNGMDEAQSYAYAPDSEAPEIGIYRTKDGRWKMSGTGTYVMLGERREYFDYGF